MRLRELIAGIHPRLAVVVHDMLMVWLAWTAVSMLRWSLGQLPANGAATVSARARVEEVQPPVPKAPAAPAGAAPKSLPASR